MEKDRFYPFQPEVVINKFLPKEDNIEERPLSRESFKSILIAANQKRIKKKFKEVITNIFNIKVKELTSTIRGLVIINILLKSQI